MAKVITVMLPLAILIAGGTIFGIVSLIKYFIRYNARVQGQKSPRQEELERMKLDDL